MWARSRGVVLGEDLAGLRMTNRVEGEFGGNQEPGRFVSVDLRQLFYHPVQRDSLLVELGERPVVPPTSSSECASNSA